MITLGTHYEQLTPVMSDVRVGVVRYQGGNPEHEAALRDALPRFLGSEGAVHGIAYPSQHVDAVIDAVNGGDIYADFLMVALDVCKPIIAGLGTGAHTFGIECDGDNNLNIVPLEHGEDTSLDLEISKLFRDYTRCLLYPKGLGLGSLFTQERLFQSVMGNPNWVSGGRDNEYSGDNPPIIGLMNKFGATLGTEKDSPVLQLDRFMSHLKHNGWIDTKTLALPSHGDNQRLCRNNFATRWTSADGKQQIALINTLIRSTFDADRIAWTKIKSNGNLPKGDQLKEVLAALLLASREEMAERKWGVPTEQSKSAAKSPIIPVTGTPQEIKAAVRAARREGFLSPAPNVNDVRSVFGGNVPVRLHLNKELEIAQALLEMKAEPRTFGHKPMLSGITSVKNIPNPHVVFGQPLPEATRVTVLDPAAEANKPCFDLISEPQMVPCDGFAPARPFGQSANDGVYVAFQAA